MAMNEKEKRRRQEERMLATAKKKKFQTSTYLRKFVAPDFQRMIRAEAGAVEMDVPAISSGEFVMVFSGLGDCVCVTCGKVLAWSTDKKAGTMGCDAGHFLASRRNSIILQETNCHPQCQYCNMHMGGMPESYMKYMMAVYGREEVERLEDLKANFSKSFLIDELVAHRIDYRERIAVALEKMGCK